MRFPNVPVFAAAIFFTGRFAAGGAAAGLTDDNPAVAGADEFRVRVEVFALPPDAARRAQKQFPKQAELYRWIETEVEKAGGMVKLERMDVLHIRSGQASKLEGLGELPYPTEFDPPQIAQTIGIGMPAYIRPQEGGGEPPVTSAPIVQAPSPAPPPAPIAAAAFSPDPPFIGVKENAGAPGEAVVPTAFPNPGPPGSIPAATRVVPPWPYTATTPSAFATKNTGWTCEANLTISEDGRTVDVEVAPEFIKLAGWETMMMNAEEVQPVFERRQMATHLKVAPGKPSLAGSFNHPVQTGAGGVAKEDATRLAFITVNQVAVVKAGGGGPADPFTEEAEEKEEDPTEPHEGFLCVEAFSLPPAAARKALVAHPQDGALYAWIDSEPGRKEAGVVLEHASTLRVRSRKPVKGEALVEWPYPTEFDPAQIPQSISLPVNAASTPIPGTNRVFSPWPLTATSPGSFSTRNLGWTVEAEVRFSRDGKIADVEMVPQFHRITGKLLFGANRDVMQPVFETQRLKTRLKALPGRPVLAGSFTPPLGTGIPGGNTSDRVWLLFATVAQAE